MRLSLSRLALSRLAVAGLLPLAALLPLPARAALSGYYDSLEQIEVVLAVPDLGDRLRQQPLTALRQDGTAEDGTLIWQLETSGCSLTIHLRAEAPKAADGTPLMGKTSYTIDRIGECH